MLSVPFCGPLLVGVNVTLMVHDDPTAMLAHVVAANGPVVATLLMVTVVLPAFVTVTVLGALVVPTFCLPKFRLVGDTLTDAVVEAETPVPVNETVWGLLEALS
jgi:hypothetical protein